MAETPSTNNGKSLHLRRYEMERLTYAVDQLIERLVSDVSLSEKIQYRKRLLASGITKEQVKSLFDQALCMEREDRTRLKSMKSWQVPIETVIHYVSAPMTRTHEDVPVREEIYNQIASSQSQSRLTLTDGGVSRPAYVGAFLAASTSVTFFASRAAGLSDAAAWYVRPVARLFDQMDAVLPALADAIGLDAVSQLSSAMPGSAGALLLGTGLVAALFQRSNARAQHISLAGDLERPASGVAQELFGEGRQTQLWSRYQRLTEGHKHLLSHLSPHELRVVLLGGPQAAKDVLISRPVSYQQQMHALAHDAAGRLDFIARMMELSLPEVAKAPVRALFGRLDDKLVEDRTTVSVVDAIYPSLPASKEPLGEPPRVRLRPASP